MKTNKTLSDGRDQHGAGTFANLVKGDAEQVTPNGLQWGMGGESLDNRGGVRGERVVMSLGGAPVLPTSKPVTRGIKHVR
jgi:hypothetical protein